VVLQANNPTLATNEAVVNVGHPAAGLDVDQKSVLIVSKIFLRK
jgi:hypothetical protein